MFRHSTSMPPSVDANTQPRGQCHEAVGRYHHHPNDDPQQVDSRRSSNMMMSFESVYNQVLSNAEGSNNSSKLQQQQGYKKKQPCDGQPLNDSSSSNSGIVITEYTVMDILSGRGGLANRHAGNRVYRRLIDMNKPFYRKLSSKTRKSQLVESILRAIHNQGGRFLKQQNNIKKNNKNQWFEIDYKEAFVKTSQALREPIRKQGDNNGSSSSTTSSSAAAAASKKMQASPSEAASTTSDKDEDEETATDYEDDDDDDEGDQKGSNNNNHIMNHQDQDTNLSDQDMTMLLRESTTMFRATTLDLFPETATMLDDPSATATAANHYHYPHHQHHRQTWCGANTTANDNNHHHHHVRSSLGKPTTGDLLDEETLEQGTSSSMLFQPNTNHTYNNTIGVTGLIRRATSSTSQSAPSSPASTRTIKTAMAFSGNSSAPSSPVLAASLLLMAAEGNNNFNVNRASLSLPPLPESLLMRMTSTSSRAVDHLTNQSSNDDNHQHHHRRQHDNNNNNNQMPSALEPLSQMRSSTFFPSALDAILLRQDSLDLSSSTSMFFS